MKTSSLDTLSGVIVILAVAEGLVPFPARLLGWTPIWCLPTRLDAPTWWITSLVVVLVAGAAIVGLEWAKKRTDR